MVNKENITTYIKLIGNGVLLIWGNQKHIAYSRGHS